MEKSKEFQELIDKANKADPNIVKKVYRYSYDKFFKYLLENNDYIRLMLCSTLMPEVKIVSADIQPNDIISETYEGKDMFLDILAKDDHGNLYDLEMQCYTITDIEFTRFLSYGCNLISSQAKRGDDYSKVKPVRQMIINAGNNVNELEHYIHIFEYYDKTYSKEYPRSLMKTMFINLGHIDEIQDMNEFNQLMYLFKYDKLCDKIKSSEEIEKVTKLHKEYTEEDMMHSIIKKELDEWYYQAKLHQSNEIGYNKGYNTGIEEGKNQERINLIKMILEQKFFDTSFLDENMDITEEQVKAILSASTIEEVKNILK